MTPTDKFRALLDEYGVGWVDMSKDGKYLSTVYDGLGDMRFIAVETPNQVPADKVFVNGKFMSPEEAIVATVGVQSVEVSKVDDGLPDHKVQTYFCESCGTWFIAYTRNDDGDTYDVDVTSCPHCGKKISTING